MTLNEYLNNTNLNEDAIGPGTTSHGVAGGPTNSGDITYIPGGYKVAGSLLQQAKRRKPVLMNIIKGPKQRRVKIGEAVIDVRNEYWNEFKKEVFGGVEPFESIYVDLSPYLRESLDTEVNVAMNKLKERFTALLNEEQFLAQRRKITSFIKMSGDTQLNFHKPEKTLVSEPTVDSQVNYFLQTVSKAYLNNVGEIEILIHHITNRLSLSSITLFRNLDNLSGNVLAGKFFNQYFTFSTVVDLNYELVEYLSFNNEDLLNRFKSHPGFKVEGHKVWPADEVGFNANICETIKKLIEGVPNDSTRE